LHLDRRPAHVSGRFGSRRRSRVWSAPAALRGASRRHDLVRRAAVRRGSRRGAVSGGSPHGGGAIGPSRRRVQLDVETQTVNREGGFRMHWRRCVLAAIWMGSAIGSFAETAPWYQADFPPEEFRARWEKIFAKIGDKSVALVAGAPSVGGFVFPRQFNEFYYLCG